MRTLGCFDYIEAKQAPEISMQDLRFKNPHSAAILCVS
jgi:glucosamine--fructose-6-phosphate aminotransferase (isomerizing)